MVAFSGEWNDLAGNHFETAPASAEVPDRRVVVLALFAVAGAAKVGGDLLRVDGLADR